SDEEDRRYRPDRIAGGEGVVLVHVHLRQRNSPSGVTGQLLEHRGDRPTGAAPLSPEVHHHEALLQRKGLIEVLFRQVDGIGHGGGSLPEKSTATLTYIAQARNLWCRRNRRFLVSLTFQRARVDLDMDPAKILVVDDERSILVLLKEALGQWGYQVTTVASATEALGILKSELFDALITDIRMPDMSGLELLREVKKQDESIEVVMMTGYPTIASAVQALKEGAYDYLSKPLILDELRHLMSRMMERKFLRGEIHTLRARLGEELTVNELIGTSSPMERVKEIIGKVAVTDSPVLIEG